MVYFAWSTDYVGCIVISIAHMGGRLGPWLCHSLRSVGPLIFDLALLGD